MFFFSFPFPDILENDSLWYPFPNCGNGLFFIPFPFPNFGNRFIHSLPIPEFWECFFFIPFPFPNFGNGFFSFPSCSRTSGMKLSIPVPVPELPNVIPAHPWGIALLHLNFSCHSETGGKAPKRGGGRGWSMCAKCKDICSPWSQIAIPKNSATSLPPVEQNCLLRVDKVLWSNYSILDLSVPRALGCINIFEHHITAS